MSRKTCTRCGNRPYRGEGIDYCPFCGGPLTSDRVKDRRSLRNAYKQTHPDNRGPVEREAELIWGAAKEGGMDGCANSCAYGCGTGCLTALVIVAAVVLLLVLVLT
jgi:hypothetical protein